MAAVTFYCLELCCLNYPQNLLHTIINLNHVTHSGDDVTWLSIVTSWWRHSHLYMWRFYCKFLQSKRLHFSSPCINHSYIYDSYRWVIAHDSLVLRILPSYGEPSLFLSRDSVHLHPSSKDRKGIFAEARTVSTRMWRHKSQLWVISIMTHHNCDHSDLPILMPNSFTTAT